MNPIVPDYEKLEEKNLVYGVIPPQKFVLKITLEGSYINLPDAWMAGCKYIQDHKLSFDTFLPAWEEYTVPMDENRDDSKSVTEIYIPVLTDGKKSKHLIVGENTGDSWKS